MTQIFRSAFQRSSTTPTAYSSGRPILNFVGGSKRSLGNMKRPIAASMAREAAVKAAQPVATRWRKVRRGTPPAAGADAPGLAGACGAALTGGVISGPHALDLGERHRRQRAKRGVFDFVIAVLFRMLPDLRQRLLVAELREAFDRAAEVERLFLRGQLLGLEVLPVEEAPEGGHPRRV